MGVQAGMLSTSRPFFYFASSQIFCVKKQQRWPPQGVGIMILLYEKQTAKMTGT